MPRHRQGSVDQRSRTRIVDGGAGLRCNPQTRHDQIAARCQTEAIYVNTSMEQPWFPCKFQRCQPACQQSGQVRTTFKLPIGAIALQTTEKYRNCLPKSAVCAVERQLISRLQVLMRPDVPTVRMSNVTPSTRAQILTALCLSRQRSLTFLTYCFFLLLFYLFIFRRANKKVTCKYWQIDRYEGCKMRFNEKQSQARQQGSKAAERRQSAREANEWKGDIW